MGAYLREHLLQNPVDAFVSVSCNPVLVAICWRRNDACELSGERIQISSSTAFSHSSL
jgi:hypothetical protein